MFGFLKTKNKQETQENPLKGQRFNDGVLIITQNNSEKTVKIEAANMNALNMLGYSQEEILDRDLRELVTSNIADDINEYLEFENAGKDLDQVLSRIRRFKMRRKGGGDDIALSLRVVRSISTDASPRFQMVLNDGSLIASIEENREKYRSNLRGDEIFDSVTGLLSKESIAKDIELISFNSTDRDLKSSLAKIEIKNYNQILSEHGAEATHQFLKEVAAKIKNNKREHDIVGVASEGKFAVILTETPTENVRIPIDRMDDLLNAPKYDIEVDGSKVRIEPKFEITCKPINKDTSKEDLLA